MRKLLIILLATAAAGFSTSCIATRNFVRGDVKASSDALSARIDKNDGEIKETRDGVDKVNQRVTTVDGRVTDLDTKTTQQLNGVRDDVKTADGDAKKAQASADKASAGVTVVDQKIGQFDQKWLNRNQFVVGSSKAVQFKVNSAKLEEPYKGALDELADAMSKSPDALLVLEGRTDSTGDADYNVALAQRRADAVERYLVVEKNVPAYRIHQVSFGADRPIADNKSRDGREQNRAVTMSLMVPKQQ